MPAFSVVISPRTNENLEHRTQFIRTCAHRSLPLSLIERGLFPSGPSSPGFGFTINLIHFLSEIVRSPVASVQGLAGALHRHHRFLGRVLRSNNNVPVLEGFRRSLQHALQWFDVVYARVQLIVAAVSEKGSNPVLVSDELKHQATLASPTQPSLDSNPSSNRLQTTTPAPDWLTQYQKKPASAGGNIHGAVDGNFSLRHNARSGECPDIDYRMQIILPKSFVDAVGRAHNIAAKRKPRTYAGIVPDVVIDECENSHTAADGKKGKATKTSHDDKGVMAFVCRHDIPWFACNIDTPGEQQKYALSLILVVMLHLPESATMALLYDIGCVTSRVIQLVLRHTHAGMRERLVFATSAMHAYVHQWSCQLGFNPRLQPGFGLTDGEGVERLWSRMRDLISILRCVSRLRRLVILDQHLCWVGQEMRDDLGRWDTRRTKLIKRRRTDAMVELRASDGALPLIQCQWDLQRAAQLSVQSMTKPRLKHEVQTVMKIQDDVAKVEDDIDEAEDVLGRGPTSSRLPHYRKYNPKLVRLLVEAYDAKCIARHKLIGRFFEWDRLNRAVGGVYAPVDHQRSLGNLDRTRKSTIKCIERYNGLCKQIATLTPAPGDDIALPQPLDTNLAKLRDSPALLEDVWIGGPRLATDRWLTDVSVRVAIRAMHQLDRCREEEVRLLRERDNLTRWALAEWVSIGEALQDENSTSLTSHLSVTEHLQIRVRLEDLASGMRGFPGFVQDVYGPPRVADADRAEAAPPLPQHPDADIPTAFRDALAQAADAHDAEDSDVNEEVDLEDVEQETSAVLVHEALDDDDDDVLEVVKVHFKRDLREALRLNSVSIQARDQRRLVNGQMVSEDVVWTALAAFQLAFPRSAGSIALLNTYPYEQWLEGSPLSTIFKSAKTSQYWLARRILLPVYDRDGLHWMAAMVRPAKARIDFYDSFARLDKCEEHGRITNLSDRQPDRVQENMVDCGLWTVANLAAIMRGYRIAGCGESDMTRF
ncbi:hypothetical protein BKA62DRAFT_745289 [Auriculariales sp. MPI-PUGE-AT-0066]|nr:hypothetical protein BKA62DRAFT_745289 [Auriculariales sp. MPI-PUGE-AT-0066]